MAVAVVDPCDPPFVYLPVAAAAAAAAAADPWAPTDTVGAIWHPVIRIVDDCVPT